VEPAVDLAVAASIVSSLRNRATAAQLLFLGELGLAGEVRGIPHLQQRLHEGKRLGFTRAIVPKFNLEGLNVPSGMQVVGVSSLQEAFASVF